MNKTQSIAIDHGQNSHPSQNGFSNDLDLAEISEDKTPKQFTFKNVFNSLFSSGNLASTHSDPLQSRSKIFVLGENHLDSRIPDLQRDWIAALKEKHSNDSLIFLREGLPRYLSEVSCVLQGIRKTRPDLWESKLTFQELCSTVVSACGEGYGWDDLHAMEESGKIDAHLYGMEPEYQQLKAKQTELTQEENEFLRKTEELKAWNGKRDETISETVAKFQELDPGRVIVVIAGGAWHTKRWEDQNKLPGAVFMRLNYEPTAQESANYDQLVTGKKMREAMSDQYIPVEVQEQILEKGFFRDGPYSLRKLNPNCPHPFDNLRI